MSVLDKLKSASARLGPNKLKRAKQALKNYGLREFVRRGAARLRGTDSAHMDGGRRLVVTNESYYPPKELHGFKVRSRVVFVTAPSKDSITQIEIRTKSGGSKADSRLRLEICDGDAVIASGSAGVVEDGGDTVIRFPPLHGVFGHPLRFTLTAEGEGTGILVNPAKEKDGFAVEGGGSIACRIYGMEGEDPYQEWISWNDPAPDELERQRRVKSMGRTGVIFAADSPDDKKTAAFLRSLQEQTYGDWHAYVVCRPETEEAWNELTKENPRLTCLLQSEDMTTKELAESVEEDIVLLAGSGTILAPHALFSCAEAAKQNPDADFMYFDEDILGAADGARREPFFKPDYSPNLLLAYNYIGSVVAVRRDLLAKTDTRSAYDLVLQSADASKRILHIPDVLFHVVAAEGESAGRACAADLPAVEAALKRRGISADVRFEPDVERFEGDYALPAPAPRVLILIPSHDGADMLRECITSILEKTDYPNYEIVIIENNSKEEETFEYYEELRDVPNMQILTWNHPFNFAQINNWAVRQTESKGDLLLFLNNDTSVITPDWLTRMAALCARPDVGAVGAKLLYPDNTIQHGGVVMRMMGIAGHAHLGQPAGADGSFGRLQTVFDVSGATGACLMVPRSVFEKVGGFDEQYVLAFNDVDLCLKIRELGLTILFEPRAELYHYESKTRGYEITPEQQKRFRNEQIIWIRKWLEKYPGDPFYNPNLRYDTCGFDTAPEKSGESMKRVAKPYDDLIDAEIEP